MPGVVEHCFFRNFVGEKVCDSKISAAIESHVEGGEVCGVLKADSSTITWLYTLCYADADQVNREMEMYAEAFHMQEEALAENRGTESTLQTIFFFAPVENWTDQF